MLLNSQFLHLVQCLKSNELDQLEFKLEKNIGIQKHAGKVGKKYNFDQILILGDVDRALTSSVHTVVILELCLLVTAQKRRCMKAKS